MRTACGQRPPVLVFLAVLPAALALLGAVGCGSGGSQEGENYGNLLNSPQGLVLVREEHPSGWMRPDCFACHEPRNMHEVNRTGLPDCADAPQESCIDLPGIRALIAERGEASCILCHGDNGVRP